MDDPLGNPNPLQNSNPKIYEASATVWLIVEEVYTTIGRSVFGHH